ncbi:MAG: OsmC family protein [Anaerolineae bacterium]
MSKITTYYKGDMLFESEIGKHTLTIDVPESMGGKDRGPMPPQVFIASLGSCVGALVVDYCNKVGINAEDMTVDVSFEKAEDPSRLTDIAVTVNLPHGDCGRRVPAIKRVAEHCPVHATISTLEGITVEILGQDACKMPTKTA